MTVNPFDEINKQLQEIKALILQLSITGNNEVVINKPITQKELASFLDCTEQTIINMRKRKEIPFYFVGNSPRFNLEKVIKALEK